MISNESTTTSNSQPAPEERVRQRLIRSTTDKKVFGVCGGIAKNFDVDPTIVRLAFVALTLFGGAALPFYIVAALVMPEDTSVDPLNAPTNPSESFPMTSLA